MPVFFGGWLLLIGWLFLLCFVSGLLGSTRRIGFRIAFVLSFVLTPLGAALIAVLSGRRVRRRKES